MYRAPPTNSAAEQHVVIKELETNDSCTVFVRIFCSKGIFRDA